MRPQARLGVDMHTCTVPPAFQSPLLPPCSPNVHVNSIPAARSIIDMTMSGPVGPTPPAAHFFPKGSFTVQINMMMPLRVGDTCLFGGPLSMGSPNVQTGG